MGEKGIDDLASLFLPDLLTPLANSNDLPRPELEENIYPFSSEEPVFRPNSGATEPKLYVGPHQNSGLPDMNYPSAVDAPQQYQMMNQATMQNTNTSPYSNGNTFNNAFSANRVFSPYPEIDFGHFPHHADFVSNQPELSQQLRHRQPHMMPSQPSMQPALSSYESHLWPMDSQNGMHQGPSRVMDGYQAYYGQGPSMSDSRLQGPNMKDSHVRAHTPKEGRLVEAQAKKRESKTHADPSVVAEAKKGTRENAQINMNYAPDVLIRLLDLKPVSVNSSCQSAVSLGGFLRGRLLTNNEDNFKYISVTSGAVDPSLVYSPSVISCYRRNYINLHLRCSIDLAQIPQHNNESVQRFRLVISAQTEAHNPTPVTFLIMSDTKDKKELIKSESLPMKLIDPVHVIELSECQEEQYFLVKKLKFNSATANSTHFSFQTYNQLRVSLYAEYPSGDQLISQSKSSSLIVRGRNPSFYHSKNDHLIKSRPPYYKSSFESSLMSDVPDLSKVPHKEAIEQHNLASSGMKSGDMSQSNEVKQDDFLRSKCMESLPTVKKDSDTFETQKGMDPMTGMKLEQSEDVRGKNSEDSDYNGDEVEDDDVEDDDVEDELDGGNVGEKGSDSSGDEENPAPHDNRKASTARTESPSVSAPNEKGLDKILSSMAKGEGGSYHYFPISSVYYLPPINVVYFPHGVHHTETTEDANEQASQNPDSIASPLSQTQSERKNSSKVYFR